MSGHFDMIPFVIFGGVIVGLLVAIVVEWIGRIRNRP